MRMTVRQRRFWVCVGLYLVVDGIAAVITGPTVIRGADGLEIGPLLLLGFPCSLVLMIVGAWGMAPFGDSASDWGKLVGLVAGSLANVAIAYNRMYRTRGRAPSAPREPIDL